MNKVKLRNVVLVASACIAILLVGGALWYWHHSTQQEVIPARDTYVSGNLLVGIDATSTVGTYLIGFNGMTLYTYDKDSATVSACTGICTKQYVPYLTPSKAVLANVEAGVPGTVSSVVRPNGTEQVTYNGKPLYFFTGDEVSGDMKGRGGDWAMVVVK